MPELTPGAVDALKYAHKELNRSSETIRNAYALAEESGDYSDADESAADHREHLHDVLDSLLAAFNTEYPDLFPGAS